MKFIALFFATLLMSVSAQADDIRIARQFGINYLPLIIMEKEGILQKNLEKAGIKDAKIKWVQLNGAVAINEAIISGNLEFGTTGPAPAIILWDKTKKNLGVKSVAAMNVIPMHLITNDPKIKSLKDFGPKDKIALPSAKVSAQAIILQIAAEKEFGAGNNTKLDKNTVTMSHPEAVGALSGKSIITAHFSTPPYSISQLSQPGLHSILNDRDVLGEPSNGNLVFTTTKFYQERPKEYKAFADSLKESIDFINNNKDKAAEIYSRTDSAYSKDFIRKLLDNPEIQFTTKPHGLEKFADYMFRSKLIKNKPETISELFFPQ